MQSNVAGESQEALDGKKIFCSFTNLCMWSQKWDCLAVPFLGPCLGSFLKVFCIFNETLKLVVTGRATRELF